MGLGLALKECAESDPDFPASKKRRSEVTDEAFR